MKPSHYKGTSSNSYAWSSNIIHFTNIIRTQNWYPYYRMIFFTYGFPPDLWCCWLFINSVMEVMVVLGPVGTRGLRESNIYTSFNFCKKKMDDMNKFCEANKLIKTTLTIGDVTIPPENFPCFELLVMLAIIVFLLLLILIVYCCYRCRLKRRWDTLASWTLWRKLTSYIDLILYFKCFLLLIVHKG